MTLSVDNSSFLQRRDRLLLGLLISSACCCGLVLLLMLVFISGEAWPALREIGIVSFFTDGAWNPNAEQAQFGMLPMIAASLAAACCAALLAVPCGIGIALFLHAYAPPPLALLLRRMLEILAGTPSVVYGFWGLVVLVPLIADLSSNGAGQCLLAGACVLALMTLPTVALASDAALAAVAEEQRQAARALGLSRWCMLRRVVLPQAAGGVAIAGILQIGRALGETMVVLMLCGNLVAWPDGPFAQVRTLTANIALEMGYAGSMHRSTLFVSALLLMLVLAGLVFAAHRMQRSRQGAAHVA